MMWAKISFIASVCVIALGLMMTTWSPVSLAGSDKIPDNAAGIAPLSSGRFHETFKRESDDILAADCEGDPAWQDAGAGLPGYVHDIVELAGELYAICEERNTLHLARFDGIRWYDEGPLPIVDVWKLSLQAFKGEIYVGCIYHSGSVFNEFGSILKWNGADWQAPGGGIQGQVRCMEVYGGKLYVGGEFNRAGSVETKYLAVWDGDRWEAIGNIRRGRVASLLVHKGDLYVGGSFKIVDERPIPYVARWDGKNWYSLGRNINNDVSLMASYKDDLYVYGEDLRSAGGELVLRTAIWNGENYRRAPARMDRFLSLGCWITVGDKMYLSGLVTGEHPLFIEQLGVAMFDGQRWSVIGTTNAGTVSDKMGLAMIRGTLFFAGRFTKICDETVNFVASLGDADVHNFVSGVVYNDATEDCKMDAGEFGIGRAIISVEPGPIFTRTRSDGGYRLHLYPGEYSVSANPGSYWEQSCPDGKNAYSLTISSGKEEHSDLNFGNQAQGAVQALDVGVVGAGPLRPGRTADFLISYSNVGNVPFNGYLHLQFDAPLEFLNSEPAVDILKSQELLWYVEDMPFGAVDKVWISFGLPPDESITGQEVCVRAVSRPERRADEILDAIEDEFCREITNAIDPNIISVAPAGIGPEGKITADVEELSYTVQFQNTGTDTAFNVTVVNRLDHRLFDIGSLRIGAASHKFSFELSGSGILTWTFDNIMLPDSNVNEATSHGVLKYKVKLRPGLAVGTAIRNRAGIYFDFNKPVITNTARTTIASEATSVKPEGFDAQVSVYPNPAFELLAIEGADMAAGLIILRNTLGQTVRRL